jgi:maltooligosyltrehalose synthase
MKKKRTRRSETKYPALDPRFNLKTRAELIDCDYIDQLNDKEKQWLNDFNNEFVNADFKTNIKEGRKRIHKKKRSEHEKNKHLKKLIVDFLANIKKFITILNESQITNNSKSKLKKSVNKFKKQLRTQIKKEFKFIDDSYKTSAEFDNNHRNMCILTKQKAMGSLKSLDVLPETIMQKKDTENDIIEAIDRKKAGVEDED